MTKKVGIITLYYDNFNYGGLLQSFALVKALQSLEYDVEQISFDRYSEPMYFKKHGIGAILNKAISDPIGCIKLLHRYLYSHSHKSIVADCNTRLQLRWKKMKAYEQLIPHSKVYRLKDLSDSNSVYDVFICGSDQIWNPKFLRDSFLLPFVKEDRLKIAYAASLGKNKLSEEQLKYFKDKLVSFDAISVRETAGKEILQTVTDQSIEVVVDPTLLLSKPIWEQEMKPYDLKEKYLFCYLLGKSASQRKAVKKFSEKTGLKIAMISHAAYGFHVVDLDFGDYKLYDVGPAEFLYLIHQAEYVFTDSFHASVFSILFEKQFAVFKRQEMGNDMSSRLCTLLEGFGLVNQLIDSKSFMRKLDFPYIDYSNLKNDMEYEIRKSWNYLIQNLQE